MFEKLNTSSIPELRFLHDWIEQNEAQYKSILNQYADVLKEIISLREDDIDRIGIAKKIIQDNKIEYFNASDFEVITFLKTGAKNKSIMENALSEIFSPDTTAILNLQTLLENGSEIAINNSTKPKDWNLLWDEVIWGHTQLAHSASEIVMIHFLVSHYIAQFINLKLWEVYWFKQKDDFLLVMTDILMLSRWKHEEIYKIWNLSKSEWWLWWINEKQLKYFSQ